MDTSKSFSTYVFPPLFVAGAVALKDLYIDGYSISDGVLLVDIGLNVATYLISDVAIEFGVNRMFERSPDSDLLKAGSDIIVQPLLHGLILAGIRPMIHTQQTLITHPVTLFSSFVDGFIYNIVAKYLSSPLVIYFSK